ncbi:helix-turn-helix domain-containing protein [Paractinoplanes atraurantiacus]|uniref:helix-turn-helix domain-containing protein n=1 Tax=Paractinoplanes atraurantiacus TaxID=1036182 RepID=UPI001177BD7E|nr:helix-turn-helix domain-containing protein [Actinoplanes atraurantiacus]
MPTAPMTLEEHRSRLTRYAELIAENGHRPAEPHPLANWIENIIGVGYAQVPDEFRREARAVYETALSAHLWAKVQAVTAELAAAAIGTPTSLRRARQLAVGYAAGRYNTGQRAAIDAALPADWRSLATTPRQRRRADLPAHRHLAEELRGFVAQAGRLPLPSERRDLVRFADIYARGKAPISVPPALVTEVLDIIASTPPAVWHQSFTSAQAALKGRTIARRARRWLLAQQRALVDGQLTSGQQQLMASLPKGWLERAQEQESRAPPRMNPVVVNANLRRQGTAAARTVVAAQAALRLCDQPDFRRVLETRVAHPEASLSELAAQCGMTKDAYSSRLRRALAVAA